MLYLFDKNENLIHELASNEIESLIQHEELNKLMTLEFGVFIDSNDKMKDIEYVAHKDMEDYEKIQMYRVISSESDDYTVNYQAVHIIFDELKSYGYIRDKRPDKVKASVALNIALAGSRWKVGRVDDSQLLSTNFYDCTRIDALSKIIKTWNLDLHFYLTFDGNKITGRYIDLLSFRGEDTGERFVYGSNALEVVKEVDKSEVYTRVIPRGKGEEKLDEEGKPTDGYGRRIKIDDVIWEKSKGNPIDKPKGQEYLELKEMTNKFGFSDGEPRTRVQIFEDIEDPKELIKAGYNFLVQVSRPLVQFKTKISKSSRTNVGDIVRIIRWDLDLKYRTRIYKAHRNLLNRTLEVEFGDKLVTSPADRDKIVNDNLNALENRLKETETDLKSSFIDKVTDGITQATFNRDGYNYELKKGNKYGLPAGYYSFDREIDNNPQRVIYVGAGTLAIADSKKSNGDWNFRTFGTGKGFVADLLVAGTILGGNVRWNLEDGTFLIGKNANDYSMYWDGGTLHFRNVDIDLKNSKDFSEIKDDLDKKISKEDILEDKEIQDALKGKDGANGIPGKDGKDGMPGKAGADGKTSYMHFAYADSADGVVGFTLTATNGKKYIGFYTDFVKEDSKDPKKYTWQLVKGNKGEKGEPGKDGKNINRNYIDDSKFKTVTVPKKLYDEAYNIDPSFWDTYNRQAMTLSFWFKARESKTYKRNFVVHFRAAPWYQFGTVVYPENTTENIFYKMHIGSKMMPQDYRAAQIFIRFIEEYSGNVFEIKDLKLEFGNEATDWIPSVNDLKGEPGKNGVDGKTGKIGQNLLRNSNVPIENKNYPTNIWNLCETPTTGETMTFTVKIKLEKDDKICLYNSGGYIWMGDWTKINKIDDYQIWSKTFEWKDKIQYNGVVYVQTNPPTLRLYTYSNGNGEDKNNTVSIEWATLTRGDIPAIEWTPCYADVDDAIKAGKEESEEISRKLIKVESDFKIENNNIKASVSSLSKTTERSFVNLKKDM
ncbi:phage tail spike protein, partial [Anaerococcus sp.]|uniref:phage tail spike protein n=1 Tax=Anaerococcus sp. TaxID=1872515 RepID=UPI0028FFBB0A